mmetsp:Transcript_78421/g.229919  ORF Transcript_78421/g.229919 Transcript_78421/m.229919 type:complete len:266 (-) Transcript_78421:133-930(-)
MPDGVRGHPAIAPGQDLGLQDLAVILLPEVVLAEADKGLQGVEVLVDLARDHLEGAVRQPEGKGQVSLRVELLSPGQGLLPVHVLLAAQLCQRLLESFPDPLGPLQGLGAQRGARMAPDLQPAAPVHGIQHRHVRHGHLRRVLGKGFRRRGRPAALGWPRRAARGLGGPRAADRGPPRAHGASGGDVLHGLVPILRGGILEEPPWGLVHPPELPLLVLLRPLLVHLVPGNGNVPGVRVARGRAAAARRRLRPGSDWRVPRRPPPL